MQRAKKILLVSNYRPDRQYSMLHYSNWLHASLNEHGYQAERKEPPARFGHLVAANSTASKWLGYLDKYLFFPFELLAISRQFDLVHICDHSNALYRWFCRGRPVLITCHDMLAIRVARGEIEGQRTRWSGKILQWLILNSLKRIRYFCCVSEATKSDVIRLVGDSGRNIRTIHLPLNYDYRPLAEHEVAARLQHAGINIAGPFFLHVGGDQWYKNKTGILKLFLVLKRDPRFRDHSLVFIGQPIKSKTKDLWRNRKLYEDIHEIENPSSDIIHALYCRAEALLFISLYEGYGWPVLEAQACGCPVITSNREPMTSVGGAAAGEMMRTSLISRLACSSESLKRDRNDS